VLYGTVDTVIEGKTYSLSAEESILIPPNAVRSPRCGGKAPGYMNAIFDNHGLELDPLAMRVLSMPLELRPDLHALVSELQRPGTNTEDLVDSLLVRLLIGLCRLVWQENSLNSARLSPLNATSHHELVARIDVFMRRNLHQPLTRQDLADAAHLSPTHLARVFQQITGQTLIERLTELRVNYAKELLLQSTLSITEISLQVGYNSFSHFSKVFKTAVGVSPSDYRRSQGLTWRK
jgi:AraC-like DNA-binding protein